MDGNSYLSLEVDKPFYTQGETVSRVLRVRTGHTVKVRSLDVYLSGREKVVIDPPMYVAPAVYHKAHYSSTNEMLNVGVRLLENTTLNPGDREMHFQFQLPANALPSYVGSYAAVIWKLSAKADIPWSSDLTAETYLRIHTRRIENPSPVSLENPEKTPRLRLELSSNVIEPGEVVSGNLTLMEPGSLRSLRLQTVLNEDATARGTLTDSHKTRSREVGPDIELSRDHFQSDSPVEFRFEIPRDAPSSYQGVYSSISYSIVAVLDMPHAEDIHISVPFLVGLKGATASQQVQVPSTTERLEGTVVAETTSKSYSAVSSSAQPKLIQVAPSESAAAQENRANDVSAIILKLLRDGGSKDLLTISTELQLETVEFVDLNTVRKLCEDLVSQGKLKRTGEGEFFAKYALNAPAPSGSSETGQL